MKNKEIKQEMLKNGLYSQLRTIDKKLYKTTGQSIKGYIYQNVYTDDNLQMLNFLEKQDLIDIEMSNMANSFNITNIQLKSFIQMKQAKSQQARRLYRHLNYLINNYDLLFATFTFNDEEMKLKKNTRYQHLIRSLNNDFVKDYIVNIDYGKKNEREHYHGIIAIDRNQCFKMEQHKHKGVIKCFVKDIPINYKYGFVSYEIIKNTDTDRHKIANYISKLGLHSLKVEQKRIRTKKGSDYQKYIRFLNA